MGQADTTQRNPVIDLITQGEARHCAGYDAIGGTTGESLNPSQKRKETYFKSLLNRTAGS